VALWEDEELDVALGAHGLMSSGQPWTLSTRRPAKSGGWGPGGARCPPGGGRRSRAVGAGDDAGAAVHMEPSWV
jgi:hypothetical protein